MNRVYEAELFGQKFPICYTVGALNRLTDKFGGDVGAAFSGDNAAELFKNAIEVFEILLKEGEMHERLIAKYSGENRQDRETPTADELGSLLSIADLKNIQEAITNCMKLAQAQEIDTVEEKNAKATR